MITHIHVHVNDNFYLMGSTIHNLVGFPAIHTDTRIIHPSNLSCVIKRQNLATKFQTLKHVSKTLDSKFL